MCLGTWVFSRVRIIVIFSNIKEAPFEQTIIKRSSKWSSSNHDLLKDSLWHHRYGWLSMNRPSPILVGMKSSSHPHHPRLLGHREPNTTFAHRCRFVHYISHFLFVWDDEVAWLGCHRFSYAIHIAAALYLDYNPTPKSTLLQLTAPNGLLCFADEFHKLRWSCSYIVGFSPMAFYITFFSACWIRFAALLHAL